MINYHNHTYLCGHATGEIKDYIEIAVKKKFTEIGFSDHAPISKEFRDGITMSPQQVEFYIDEILRYKKIYENKIDVKLGFEVDFPLFDDFDKKYFSDPRIDFLIGSCHFIDEWPFDHPDFIDEFEKRDIDNVYKEYFNLIEKIISSKLFNIVGHMDLIKKFGHRPHKDFSSTIEKIAILASKSNTVIEINTSGLLKPVKEIYPSYKIIKILFEKNVPITIGSDTHNPEFFAYGYEKVLEEIKKIGYKKISGFSKRKRYDIEI